MATLLLFPLLAVVAAAADCEPLLGHCTEGQDDGIGLLQVAGVARRAPPAEVASPGFHSFGVSTFDRDMASLAKDSYYAPTEPINDWVPTATADLAKDRTTVYRKGDSCVLTLSGTDDPQDVLSDMDFRPTSLAPMNLKGAIHHGFLAKTRKLLVSPMWEEVFVPALMPCLEIITVGHSLGGAKAVLLAALLNANPETLQLPKDGATPATQVLTHGLTVSKVFTFGAPGVTYKEQLFNAKSSNGEFEGARYFVQDEGSYDPVTLTSFLGLLHPPMPAVRLSLNREKTQVSIQSVDAASPQARSAPSGSKLPPPSATCHRIVTYIARISEGLSVEPASAPKTPE